MSIEAMKQALEALELALRCHGVMLLSDPPKDAWKYHGVEADANKAITALRTAIAEAEKQEPVAWLEPEWGEKICPEVGYEVTMTDDHPKDLCWIPLYTTPPAAQRKEWQGLTDEEVKDIVWNLPYEPSQEHIRAIEAKLKEKNNGRAEQPPPNYAACMKKTNG
jgi:hypothetical protein